MLAAEIRTRFLRFFQRHGHAIRPSSSLVPHDDPTLLFTNAGMVPFKRIFLGLEQPEFGRRATTAQKCVRAGGKHNDLEQVGHTARHHTFFEMLGNFSFGDYFKRDAIRFAWSFVTEELGLDPTDLRVTIFHEDEEARALWREIAGLPDERIYGLGEKDNFWQMAETGPCGPCTEIYVDLARVARDWAVPEAAVTSAVGGDGPAAAAAAWMDVERREFTADEFVEGAEAGRFLEIWNLVFMQYDRQADGSLVLLPRPSVDTGAGLERIAAVMQGDTNNYHTDLFLPLLERVSEVVGLPYGGRAPAGERSGADPASFRVLADHARAVAFLLADGVYPANEGRGYVLRRILRRAVRHAWLLGRREPTLAPVVEAVVATMGDVYPELRLRERHIVETTRAEEERFLATIEGGMQRFEQIAPAETTQGSLAVRGTISGEDAFRLYDTFGFPIDLTELMARERGYTVDLDGFGRALEAQRALSREERRTRDLGVREDELAPGAAWVRVADGAGEGHHFVGYDAIEVVTHAVAARHLADGRIAVVLAESPFYAASGGQVADTGEIEGEGWHVWVDDVRRVEQATAAVGRLEGEFRLGPARARVPTTRRRDTERNHTATHLLHAALRLVLGEHVHQAGSLVAPDRLRFDFTSHGPVSPAQLAEVERRVNEAVWANVPLVVEQRSYAEAVAAGAMALFGEKYGDVVRVVQIPGLSMELCGGTHVRATGEIGLFRILSEGGVAAGVRRIEAVTGSAAYDSVVAAEARLRAISERLRTPRDAVERRVDALLEERRALQQRLDEVLRGGTNGAGGHGGGDVLQGLLDSAVAVDGARVVSSAVSAGDVRELQAIGDALRERMGSGVGVVGTTFADGKSTLLAVVTDDLRARGVRADELVREIAALGGGRGGGKPHMAQAGLPDAARLREVLDRAPEVVRVRLGRAAAGA